MPYLIYALLFLLLSGVVFALAKKRKHKADGVFPYQKNQTLLSPSEKSFLEVLETVADGGYRIFCKVRLADVVHAKRGLPRAAGQDALNAISGRRVDFLICGRNDMSIKGAVALDDQNRNDPRDNRRDFFLDKVFEAAGVPFLKVKARAGYSLSEIKSLMEGHRIIRSKSRPGQVLDLSKQIDNEFLSAELQAELQLDEKTVSIEPEVELLCPKCGAALVEKVAIRGKYAGRKYFGCSNFPHCRYACESK